MPEGETETTSRSKKDLTRREFLKLIKYGALVVAGKFFWNLYKDMFADIGMMTRCMFTDTGEARHLWETELKDKYDTALLVIHPGYGLLRDPDRFKDKEGYKADK